MENFDVNDTATQLKTVREWLQSGKSITSYEAFVRWKMTRLSAYIHTLIHVENMNIVGSREKNESSGKFYKRYRLAE